ncbi:MAG: hypothetical protein E4H27_02730 [Anaerolineales bacterium]|nr:MAG: hypothetical protein E4H27_02730 [Anaerolineales bacterium]
MSKDKPLPAGFVVNDAIASEIQAQISDNGLSCAKAHAIAKKYNAPPSEIGTTADALKLRLNRCQLGLFGYPNKKGWEASGVSVLPVPEGFEQALIAQTAPTGHITCAAFWKFISDYNLSRMQAGYIADQLEIRITNCQIGAF